MGKDKRPMPAEWLDTLETERRALIMRLRQIDSVLLRHGRLRRRTVKVEGNGTN